MNKQVNEYDALYDDIYDYDLNETLNAKNNEAVNYDLNCELREKKLISENKLSGGITDNVNDKEINSKEQKDNKTKLSHELKNKNNYKESIENEHDEAFHTEKNYIIKEVDEIEDFEKIKNLNKNNLGYSNELNSNSLCCVNIKTSHEISNNEKKMKEHEANYFDKKMIRKDEEIKYEAPDLSEKIDQKNSKSDKEKNEFHGNKSDIILNYKSGQQEINEKEPFYDAFNKNCLNKNYNEKEETKNDAELKENELFFEKSEKNKLEDNEFKYKKIEDSKLKEEKLKHQNINDQNEPEQDNLKFEEKKQCNNESAENQVKQKNANNNTFSENENKNSFECNICFDDVRDPIVTKCGHLFCWLCLCSWIKKNNDCPVCKAEVSRENVIPLYGRGQSSNQHKYTNVEEPRPIPERKEGVRRNNSSTNNLGLRASFGVWVNPFSFGLSYTNMSEEQPYFNDNRNQNRRVQTETFHAEAASSFFFFLGFFLSLYILFYSS